MLYREGRNPGVVGGNRPSDLFQTRSQGRIRRGCFGRDRENAEIIQVTVKPRFVGPAVPRRRNAVAKLPQDDDWYRGARRLSQDFSDGSLAINERGQRVRIEDQR